MRAPPLPPKTAARPCLRLRPPRMTPLVCTLSLLALVKNTQAAPCDVFVADQGIQQIVKIPGGTGAPVYVGPQLNMPTGVFVDTGNGDVYVADQFENSIALIPGGTGSMALPVGSSLYLPTSVFFNSKSTDVYVADDGNNSI